VVICGVLLALALKFTNLGLYTQAVGVNENSARLNGIDSVFIRILAFVILGVAVAVAGCMSVSRMGIMNNEGLLLNIEMDAILAVAIGGNALGGGKFNIAGSVLGAYIIQGLTTTLTAMKVPSTDVKAYKAVVIIILVVIATPVVKEKAARLWSNVRNKKAPVAAGGAQ
jgi:simple sugar transport system permease protein